MHFLQQIWHLKALQNFVLKKTPRKFCSRKSTTERYRATLPDGGEGGCPAEAMYLSLGPTKSFVLMPYAPPPHPHRTPYTFVPGFNKI